MQKNELAQHFNEKLFLPEMKATGRDKALVELLDLFIEERVIRNRELVLEMLRQRETLGSTGIGKGVAIPHGRTTATSDVKIAFGISTAGIDFEAIDNKPVHLLFMVIAPPHDEDNLYLPILGTLVTILKDRKNRDKLRKVRTFSEFLPIIIGE